MKGKGILAILVVLASLSSLTEAQRRRNRLEVMIDGFMNNMGSMADRFTSAIFPDRGPPRQRRPFPTAQSQGINNFASVPDVSNDISFDSSRKSLAEEQQRAPNSPPHGHRTQHVASVPTKHQATHGPAQEAPNAPHQFAQGEQHFRRPFPGDRERDSQYFRRPPPPPNSGFNLRRIFNDAVHTVRNLMPYNRRRIGARSMDEDGEVEETA